MTAGGEGPLARHLLGTPAGRPVLVTGGASGIGRAVVASLLADGVPVGALDQDAGALERLAQEHPGAPLRTAAASVTDGGAVEAAMARLTDGLPPLWGVVTCAGIVRDKTLLKMTDEDWRLVLEVNLTGTFFVFRAAAHRFKAHPGGRLVAISSIVGLRGGFGQTNYAASKAGVIALVKSAARELGRYAVTVNAIAPGFVRTPMTKAYGDTLEEMCKAESPLGTVSEPSDIAASVRYLLSEGAGHITGDVLRVDGGQAI